MTYLYNCTIYTGEEVLNDKAILLENGKINSIINSTEIPENSEKINLEGLSIAPGFIDLQVNGGGGVLFNNDLSQEGIEKIYNTHLKYGTTNILPTFITGPNSKMRSAANTIQDIINKKHPGILGIHFEGPFISQNKGAHNTNFIRNVSREDLEVITSIKNGKILLTLAPEVVDKKIIRDLKSKGIILSAGHSSAAFEEAQTGFKEGITGVTHLYNAMSGLHHREPGLVGAALSNENAWAGIIVDGHHIDFNVCKITYECKKGRLFLVTDSMPLMGITEDNSSYLLDGVKTILKNGMCITENGIIAGSVLDLATAVRNCIQKVGIKKEEALKMASTYPAKFIGVDDEYGFIKPGYKANLTIFDDNIFTKAVILDGKYLSNHTN